MTWLSIPVLATVIGFGSCPVVALAQNAEATTVELTGEALELSRQLAAAGPELSGAAGFYAARNYRPIWTGPGFASQLSALKNALGNADLHGLPSATYDLAGLTDVLAGVVDPASQARAEVIALQAYLAFAQDSHSGVVAPSDVDREMSVRPPLLDDTVLLAMVIASDNGADLIEALVPSHPNYQRLLNEKLRLEGVVAVVEAAGIIADGATLEIGDIDPRVAQMRDRLATIGFSAGLGNSEVYDAALAGLVTLFQEQNGLTADGVAGPRTIAAMNRSDRDRLAQVLVNLERERWLNVARGARHIQVNIPAFVAQVIDDGVVVFETKTVVGRADKFRTPEFSDTMTHMVINPSWGVPQSIVAKEFLPQLQANNAAMNRQGIQIFYKGRQIDPTRVDFNQFNADWFPVTMRQPPGAGNALGKVKFLFPNEFDIYLHDTPSKSLFDKVVRDFSHGCVRVARPLDLAYLLLSRQTDDPEGLFQRHLDSGRETTVNLDQPVPVFLTYQTVWHDAAGEIVYLEDVYGRDAKVFAALEAAGVSIGVPES